MVEKPEGKSNFEDLGIDGMIILKLICRKYDAELDSLYPAQYMDRWRAFVDKVMKLWFSQSNETVVFTKCGVGGDILTN